MGYGLSVLTKYIENERPAIVNRDEANKTGEGERKDGANHHSCNKSEITFNHETFNIHMITSMLYNRSR